ncbi:MAG: electron transport complex subunit RsxC [Paludibacteraceae bacterium]|nr:electron transport complex subunit RsxC [Paludibacteraceae bacterium]MBR1716097.1 electron transport complex subunit RsxC [Paludibacteraceae bacterium]
MNTFRIGGVHPQDNKQYSAHLPITECALPKQAIIPLVQHIGAPAQAVVEAGKKVKVGDLLAKAGGFVSANISSPVSGTVTKIDGTTDAWGAPMQAIFIDVEGDEWAEGIDRTPELVSECKLEPKEIVDKIAAAGIVGLGGACFPTHVKLLPPPGKTAEVLIINGVECEPYLTCDHQLMLEHGEEIVVGIEILMKALNVKRAIIGIENNKKDAIEHMRELTAGKAGIEVKALKLKYPQGGEKQLIDACIGRQVPSGALPIEVGAVVDNVATVYAVYEAVQKNKPLISRVMTVTGKDVKNPGNYLVRFGTPITEVIEMAGGVPEGTGKIIGGGPMMGRAMSQIDTMPANKRLSGLLFLPESESERPEPENCIRCAKCVDACPMGLEPYLLSKLSANEMWEEAEKHDIMDCIDCGCCVFTCPSHRRLLDDIRPGKATVGGIIRARAAK